MLGLGLGLGFVGILAAQEAVPPGDPVTIFAADPALDTNDANSEACFRVVCTLTEDMLDQFRVSVQPGNGQLTISHLSAGERTADAAKADTIAKPQELLFSAASGFSGATTLQTSDWTDSGALSSLVAGDEIVIIFRTGSSGQDSQKYNAAAVGASAYFKADPTDGYWNDAVVADFTSVGGGGYNYCIASIETRTGGTGGGGEDTNTNIPMNFDDPMFTGMTELTAPIFLGNGDNLSRTSIVESSGDSTIVCEGNNDVKYCRVDSRECVRITAAQLLIDHCYLEATGSGEDHADGLQAYAPGTRNGDVLIQYTHIVAHQTAATAGLLVGDDWGGSITLKNVIFNGGPFGLLVFSDAGCQINLSLQNVYFVGPFGAEGGPFSFSDVGGGTHTILQWDNVCEATIVDGVLIPGALISQPA